MFSFNIHSHSFSHVHLIGIGGVSMSGLAEVLLANGYTVSGSDMKYSPVLKKLETKGVKVFLGHNKKNIIGADLVVYTDAISMDNPEYVEAKNRDIITVDRSTFIGQLMREYKTSIAVSGTHGKTTTTGMLSVVLDNSNINPTILLGGDLDQIGGNIKIGNGELLLTEACEYKGNLLKFHATIGVILNIDADHLDYYKNLDHIITTFSDFSKMLPANGHLVINNDDTNVQKAIEDSICNKVTFGINNKSDYQASQIHFDENGLSRYQLTINGKDTYDVKLNVMGMYNIYNSLAAIATSHICGLPIENILNSIEHYTGTHRRQEYKGTLNGIKIIDDYAHHPTAIKATLSAIKNMSPNKIWCVFQPHTFTRTKALLEEFSNSFYDADKVLIADIYPAREKDTGLIHSKNLVDMLIKNKVDAVYCDSFNSITEYLRKHASEGDIILTMGAGDIYNVGEMLLGRENAAS